MIDELREIEAFIKQDTSRLSSLRKKLRRLESLVNDHNYGPALAFWERSFQPDVVSLFPDAKVLLASCGEAMKSAFREFRLEFDPRLIRECKQRNLVPIAGDNRKGFTLKGIIQIKLDFDQGTVRVGTRHKMTKVKSMVMNDILREVEHTQKRLFDRKFDPPKFIEELFAAYYRVSKGKNGEDVLLREVQKEVWAKKQKESFWESFDSAKLVEYCTDEFSVDLAMVLNMDGLHTGDGYSLLLSEGAGGITVYDNTGNFKTFKFLRFKK